MLRFAQRKVSASEDSIALSLAGHAGRWIDDELTAAGVEHRFVWAAGGETRASLSVAESDHAHLTEFYEAGTPLTEEDWAALETTVGELLSRLRSGEITPDGRRV